MHTRRLRRTAWKGWMAGLGIATAGCTPAPEPAAPMPTRAAAMSHALPGAAADTEAEAGEPLLVMADLMALVVDPAAGVLQASETRGPDAQPYGHEAWQALVEAAEGLEKSTAVLAQPGWALGRTAWLHATSELRDSSRAGAEAARAHDPVRLRAAAARVRAACEGCHERYAAGPR